MFDFAPLVGLVLTSFVATNLDNLLLLVFLLGASAGQRAAVLSGYLTAVIMVVCVAAVGVAAGALIDPAAVGYMGIVPIAMACYLLYGQYARSPEAGVPEPLPRNFATEGRVWLTSSLLMFSNSGDSITVLLPLLAESSRTALLLIISLYLVACLLWCAVALAISARPGLARRIQERGSYLVPWIMMAVGIYVLLDTRTDTLL